jgi:hypothetical protein
MGVENIWGTFEAFSAVSPGKIHIYSIGYTGIVVQTHNRRDTSWVRGVNSEMKRCVLQVLLFVHACSLAALIGAMLLQSILAHPCLEHKNVPSAFDSKWGCCSIIMQHNYKTYIDLKLVIYGCAGATAAACC